jgi:hypothetical protein
MQYNTGTNISIHLLITYRNIICPFFLAALDIYAGIKTDPKNFSNKNTGTISCGIMFGSPAEVKGQTVSQVTSKKQVASQANILDNSY